MRLNWAPCAALAILACAPAQAAFINANAVFVGGIFGTFQITFTSDIAGAQLTGVDFDLSTGTGGGPGLGLFLDPTGAAPGYLTNQNLSPIAGAAATGFLGGSGITDGSTAFALGFSDFTSGETFTFLLDVDHYVVLNTCPSSPIAAVIACNIANGLIRTNGSLVNADEYAGTGVTFHFLTPNGPRSFSSDYSPNEPIGEVANTVYDTPEPGSWALMGSGIAMLLWRGRRRIRVN